jgi:hypothetical protein
MFKGKGIDLNVVVFPVWTLKLMEVFAVCDSGNAIILFVASPN